MGMAKEYEGKSWNSVEKYEFAVKNAFLERKSQHLVELDTGSSVTKRTSWK